MKQYLCVRNGLIPQNRKSLSKKTSINNSPKKNPQKNSLPIKSFIVKDSPHKKVDIEDHFHEHEQNIIFMNMCLRKKALNRKKNQFNHTTLSPQIDQEYFCRSKINLKRKMHTSQNKYNSSRKLANKQSNLKDIYDVNFKPFIQNLGIKKDSYAKKVDMLQNKINMANYRKESTKNKLKAKNQQNNKLKLFVEGTASLTKKIRTKVIDMNGFEEKSRQSNKRRPLIRKRVSILIGTTQKQAANYLKNEQEPYSDQKAIYQFQKYLTESPENIVNKHEQQIGINNPELRQSEELGDSEIYLKTIHMV